MTQSTAASKEMNQVLLEYFDPKQLLIFRAGILFTFISPSLRGIVASYINTYIYIYIYKYYYVTANNPLKKT